MRMILSPVFEVAPRSHRPRIEMRGINGRVHEGFSLLIPCFGSVLKKKGGQGTSKEKEGAQSISKTFGT